MPRQKKVVIRVSNLTKTFKIPLEGSGGIKQKIINFFRKTQGFRNFTPLRNVSFTVNEGEFFGIVGRNGSGKSTLLKTIANIYSPTKGTTEVDGSLIPFIELGVGFNPELTGRENVFLNGALLGFSRLEMQAMYDEIVEFAEIGDFMEEKLKNYSSGMQVRLGFSIAIKAKGDILLLDEVLAVGDAAFQQKCFSYFERLKEEGRTIVLVTHDMSSVERFCTRAIYIEDGKVIANGTPEDIADIYTLRNIEASEVDKVTGLGRGYSVTNTLKSQTVDEVQIAFSVKSRSSKQLYLGISLFRDGVCVAQMNSSKSVRILGSGNIELRVSTGILNPGVYELSSALFDAKQKSLVAIPSERVRFLVRGNDETRGGAIKLDDTWKRL